MKFIQNIIYCFVLFVTLTTGTFANTHDNVFKMVFADYKPYSWKTQTGKITGLEVDILKEAIQKRMGIPILFEIQPWKRAQKNVENGQADAIFAVPNKRRKEYTTINNEILAFWGVSVFAKAKTNKILELEKIKNIDDLQNFRLGSMIGNGWSEKNFKNMDVLWVVSMKQLLMLLEKERIDAVVDSPAVMHYYIKELGLENKIIELNSFLSLPLHLCIGNKSSFVKILPLFDKTIRDMKEDGTLKRIIDKYK